MPGWIIALTSQGYMAGDEITFMNNSLQRYVVLGVIPAILQGRVIHQGFNSESIQFLFNPGTDIATADYACGQIKRVEVLFFGQIKKYIDHVLCSGFSITAGRIRKPDTSLL